MGCSRGVQEMLIEGLTFGTRYCSLLSPATPTAPALTVVTPSLLTSTQFEAADRAVPHFMGNHTKVEKVGVRSPKGLMANMALSSAPPAHSWGVLFYLPCCPSCYSCPLASLKTIRRTVASLPTSKVPRSNSGQAEFLAQHLEYTCIMWCRARDFVLKI